MGSKKILEDMFKLVTLKSGESIEEDKFNQSILSSIKVKTQKEKNAVLSELLRMLQEGNETIGEVSDGFFVCYPSIIKKTEDFVIKNLETEKLYVEKNIEITRDTSFDIKDNDEDNEKTELIESLLERFDDLDDSEFENLLDNLGEMNSSQVENFIEKYAASQEELVEAGIKDENEIEREKIEIKLSRAIKGNDHCAKYIAKKLLLLDNKKISEEELIEQIKALKDFLADNELSEEAQKLCDEVEVYEIIAILEQQISEDKLARKPENEDKNSPNSWNREDAYNTLINSWDIGFKETIKETKRIKKAISLIPSETFSQEGSKDIGVPIEMQEQQLQFLKNEWKNRRFTITESSRGLFSKEGRRKIAISKSESGLEEDSFQEAKHTAKRVVNETRPKRRRDVLPFDMASNSRILRERIYNDVNDEYISDIDFDEIYEMDAVPIKVDSLRKDTGFIKSRIQPVVGKIEVGYSRPTVKKVERIKAFLTSKAGKRQMEEASQMLFGLITEKEESIPEVSFDTDKSIKNTNKMQDNSPKDEQTPDEY